jgi:hypothetical protein
MMFPKENRERLPKWLKEIRTRKCVITHSQPVEAAHIRYGASSMGMKPSDKLVLPLSPEMHREQHRIGEAAFWCKYLPENPEFLLFCLKAGAEKLYREWSEK